MRKENKVAGNKVTLSSEHLYRIMAEANYRALESAEHENKVVCSQSEEKLVKFLKSIGVEQNCQSYSRRAA